MHKWILASLLLAGAAASGQTIKTEWKGHTYEVVWYKDIFGRDPFPELVGWWVSDDPATHAATKGGHVVTITSAEEDEAIHQLGAGTTVEGILYSVCAEMTTDRSVNPPVIHWETGETSTYFADRLTEECDHLTITGGLSGFPVGLGTGCDQYRKEGSAFYILEREPFWGHRDDDGDGIINIDEFNTRHHYEMIQVPDPWTRQNIFGGWTPERCGTDARQRGGHVVDVKDHAELTVITSTVTPWKVGLTSYMETRILTSKGAIQTHDGSGFVSWLVDRYWDERFSTYLLEVEDSTDPNDPDTDDDGFWDKDELDSGSNPLDPKSVPEVVTMQVFPALEIEVPTTLGTKYQLQVSSSLGPWLPLGGVFIGTGSPHTQFVQAREAASFVRAVIVR